ncbi:MAG: hypothetical protein HY865_19180 [Chloroflexi bacterium]|nr:hypothetical protein [Chloroflexota bacterium]
MSAYEIHEENGKFGLTYEGTVLLKPTYKSLTIINNDPPEYTLKDFEDDPGVYIVGEWNYPIVIADEKQGLAGSEGMLLDVKYDRIVKLTHCHYFSQRNTTVTLHTFSKYDFSLHNEARLTMPREFTLESLLSEISRQYPPLFEKLSEKLHESEPGKYISDYRCYWGDQHAGVFHGFLAGITKYIIYNDFHTEALQTRLRQSGQTAENQPH